MVIVCFEILMVRSLLTKKYRVEKKVVEYTELEEVYRNNHGERLNSNFTMPHIWE